MVLNTNTTFSNANQTNEQHIIHFTSECTVYFSTAEHMAWSSQRMYNFINYHCKSSQLWQLTRVGPLDPPSKPCPGSEVLCIARNCV